MEAGAVVMLIQGFHPVIGGAEKQSLELSKTLMALGIPVQVVTRRVKGCPVREMVEGVPVRRLPGWDGLGGSFAFAAAALFFLLIHRRRWRAVHAHLASSHAVAAALAARLVGKPAVVKLGGGRGVGEIALRNGVLGALKLAAFRFLKPTFIAVNRDQIAELSASPATGLPVHLVPNGVDLDVYRPLSSAEKAAARTRLGWSGTVFLFAGRLADDKGQLRALEIFLDGWSAATRGREDISFFIAGDGPAAGRVDSLLRRAGVEGAVHRLGPRGDMAALYGAADVFVLPSLSEGLSNALLEAMASGLPALAFKVTGVQDMIEEGRHGALIDPSVPGDAARALALFLDGENIPAWGRNARAAAEGYSLVKTARRCAELYGPA